MNKHHLTAAYWTGRLARIADGLDEYPRKFIDRLIEDLNDEPDTDHDEQQWLEMHGQSWAE